MSIFNGLKEIVEENYPIGKDSWFGLGGNAEYYIRPRTVEELSEVVRRCNENKLPIHVIGFGSNLLIRDQGLRGAVIKLAGSNFEKFDFQGDKLTAWAGADLNKLVLESVKKGLAGLESLAGIPGSLGGAVRMNAGGNFGDLGTAIESVTLMDNQGNVFEKSKPELVFDYRQCNITAKFILNANIKLVESSHDQLMRTVKEVWIYKKNTQPMNSHNAGCIFKNPRGMSAGAMIERTGLKGLQIGGAVVSDKHANFIVANQGCTSSDVIALIEQVRQKVRDKFEVDLALELEIW